MPSTGWSRRGSGPDGCRSGVLLAAPLAAPARLLARAVRLDETNLNHH
jgi:hypothetical protein